MIPKSRDLQPLSLKYQRVNVTIRDRAAKTTVTQVFQNHTNRVLEATYIFPLPKDANISDFVLYMNGKPVRGKVLEKNRAHSIYQSIVSRMQDPGLLDYMGGNLFRARVYPIPRNGTQKIKITFTQLIPFHSGVFHYKYPLKAPRALRLRTLNDFTMTVLLQTKAPLKTIYSPSHKIYVARKGENRASIGFEKDRAVLNKNFDLFYTVSQKSIGTSLLTFREKGEKGYFLMMISPKTSFDSKEIMGKNITFVLDTSGSMHGSKMKWAKKALISCLQKLNPKDHFNVIRFSTDVETTFSRPVLASKAKVNQAILSVQKMEAEGGTAIHSALKKALQQKESSKDMQIIVFITDGHPTVGLTNPNSIARKVKSYNQNKTKIFTFGIGSSINIKLLDKLASQNGGAGDYVKPNQEIEKRISWFYDKVRYPVLSNLDLQISGKIKLLDMYPQQLPDLYHGGQILLLGRYKGDVEGDVAVSLSGNIGKIKNKFVYEVRFPRLNKQNEFIASIWANRKIAYMLDHIRLKGENPELKTEVIRLAKKFGIVTPYTSFLVVEEKDRWRMEDKQDKTPQDSAALIPRGFNRFGDNERGGGRRFWKRRKAGSGSHSLGSSANEPKSTAKDEETSKPPAPSQQMRQYGLDDFKKDSGKKAISLSRSIREMKAKEKTSEGYAHKFVAGRLFSFKQGKWMDSRYKTSMKILVVKAWSEAYFELLKKDKSYRKLMAIGSKVVFIIDKNKAIEIDPTQGISTSKELQTFLP